MTDPTEKDRTTFVHAFDSPPPGDPKGWPEILGGKGAGLAGMRRQGVPVPPGFTIPTSVGHLVAADGWSDELDAAVRRAVVELEGSIGRRLGRGDQPLLVSVRSGAPVSMPGMMDTVLNVGMSADAAGALGRWGSDERFGWDTYLRFLDGYASIVAGAARSTIERLWLDAGAGRPAAELSAEQLADAVPRLRAKLASAGHVIPDDPYEQVRAAIKAVFLSWNSPRAIAYRQREGLSDSSGTAATVQAMVFGNLGPESGTGVVFTRDPSTGASGLMGDFLVGGQGEDVVAGTHETQPIAEMAKRWPRVADELAALAAQLEHDLGDVADIEFTVENGVLWILQARVGKRSPQAAIRLAVAMAEDPTFPLERAEAVARVADLLDDPPVVASASADNPDVTVLATGLAASPGHASGHVCVDPDDALLRAERGEAVVLIRRETSPADVHGMAVAKGLVTLLGGLVSHAAVVARSWGIPAVVGVEGLTITEDGIAVGSIAVGPQDTITVDGDRGRILLGSHDAVAAEMSEVATLRAWRAALVSPDGHDSGPASPGPDDSGPASSGPDGSGPASSGLDGSDPASPGPDGSGPASPGPDGHVLGGDAAPADGTDGSAGGRPDSRPPRTQATSEGCLRALALKGMATVDAVAAFLEGDPAEVAGLLENAVAASLAQAGPGERLLLTPQGTAAVDAAFAAEAVTARPAIEPHLDHFHHLNTRFKEVVTAWQMREEGGQHVMNDHTDPEYDASILEALSDEVHVGIITIINAIEAALPRLGAYALRLGAALEGLNEGDLELMAHPLRDSYHTVWFELHEELIRLSGRNRADETAAGRA